MSRINNPTPKLRKAPQPPLPYAGARPDADRAKRPPLVQPSAPYSELNPGDRVEGEWPTTLGKSSRSYAQSDLQSSRVYKSDHNARLKSVILVINTNFRD